MTEPESVQPHPFKKDPDALNALRCMRAIEAEFIASGLNTHMSDARAGLDLSAVRAPVGEREAEIWVDERGAVEVRYWSPPGTPPTEIAAKALRALAALTGPVAVSARPRLAQ
jgi:hypothetical protein